MRFQPQSLTPDLSARHFYGNEMRRQREAAQLSLIQLAKVLNSSKSTLARVETAELMPPPDLSDRLDAAFGTDGLFGRLYDLAKREAHPDQYRRYMDFEARARTIEQYATHVIPGLLQTEAYARAFFGYAPGITSGEVEERVSARLARQERLHSASPPRYWAILDEAILRRPIGSPAVMREQLAQLLPLMDTPTFKLQVLPFQHGGHALMGAPLTLLRLSCGQAVTYEEGRDSEHLMEDPEAVEQHWALYDALRAYALSPGDSAAFICRVMEEYESCEPAQT